MLSVVTQYTREAGVRALERAIGGVVRFKAVEWAAHIDVSSCCNFPLSIVVFYKKFDFGLDPQIPGAKRGSCLVVSITIQFIKKHLSPRYRAIT